MGAKERTKGVTEVNITTMTTDCREAHPEPEDRPDWDRIAASRWTAAPAAPHVTSPRAPH